MAHQEDAQAQEAREYIGKFISKLVAALVVLPLVYWLWPWAVPFRFWELWALHGTALDWYATAWPFLAWGSGVTLIHAILTRNDPRMNRRAEDILHGGARASIIAGVSEELTFRWLFFLNGIVGVRVANWLFFGWAGFGIARWLHLNVFGPLANWATLGFLEPYLFHTEGWFVGAALLASNAFFRDGHKYLGIFGFVNSWFAGMFLFWFMFRFGLLPAILIHFTYDFLIYLVRYADAAVERARGFV